MRIKYLTIYLLTINLLISADSDGDGIDDHVDEGKMVFHAAVQLGQITDSDFGGSSEAEELLSDLSKATIYWYGEFNQADLNKYTNNVNLHRFEMSDSQKAYIEISNTGDNSLDGIHYIDEYWGELNMLSQSDWGEIFFESRVNINGNDLTIESPRFRFSQNILDSKLESIIGLPYTIEDRSLMIDVMMVGESFTHATMMIDPLLQGASIYYTSLADVEGYTGSSIGLIASPDSDSDGVTNAFDIYPNDSNQTVGTDSDGDGIDDHVDVFPGYDDSVLTPYLNTYITNNNYVKTSEIIDLRAGSSLVTVINGVATVELEMEQSGDLQTWSEIEGSTSMDIPADTSTKFFRFKMTD